MKWFTHFKWFDSQAQRRVGRLDSCYWNTYQQYENKTRVRIVSHIGNTEQWAMKWVFEPDDEKLLYENEVTMVSEVKTNTCQLK